jgi:hypothetical protein
MVVRMRRCTVFVLLTVWAAVGLQAQVRGIVVDKRTKEPVPAATLTYQSDNRRNGVSTDINGFFVVPQKSVRRFTVSCLGYRSKEISLSPPIPEQLIIELDEEVQQLNAIVVTPANNPALRIIRNALKNKDKNNFDKYDDYSFRCYMKSTLIDEQSPGLISESVTVCRQSEGKTDERVIATRTSGLQTPLAGQLIYTFAKKNLSFYNHSIAMFGGPRAGGKYKMTMEYLSPLSSGCLDVYYYRLENEYITDTDTVFEITYHPYRHTNINGLKGRMLISSNGYALTDISAEPDEKSLMSFKARQTCEFVQGRWFPAYFEQEIGFYPYPDRYIAYHILSKADSVSFNPDNRRYNSLDRIYIDDRSLAESRAIINNIRPVPLTAKEDKIYSVMDSLTRKRPIVNSLIDMLPKVTEGKIQSGVFDIDYTRLYVHNRYEGSRLGAGVRTNEKLMKYFSVGGYYGYGLKDKRHKYGGELELTLNRLRSAKLKYSYNNTLTEVSNSVNVTIAEFYFKTIVASRFEYCIENRLDFSYHILPPLKIAAALATKDLHPAFPYSYRNKPLTFYGDDALSFSLRYAPGENHALVGATRIVTGKGNPIVSLQYTRGMDLFRKNAYAYNKFEASLSAIAYNGRTGQSNVRIEAGCVDRPLPYGLLFTGKGSYGGQLVSFIIQNTFQTMHPDEFLSDKYVNLFYTHNFGSLLFKTKWLQPEISASYNIGWGSLSDASIHETDFKLQKHLYQEAGVIADNLLKIKMMNVVYMRLGLGGFMRMGAYRYKSFADNATLKISITFAFK